MELQKILNYFSFKELNSVTNGLLIVIGTCFLYKILQVVVRWYNVRKKLPPGPMGVPILGYIPFMGKEPHKTFYKMKEKYGDIIGLYLGTKYTVILNDNNVTKEVLCNPGALDRAAEIFNHLGDIGFIIENGEQWLEQRRFCLSAARDLGLGKNHWEELVTEEVGNFIKVLQGLEGKPHDIYHEMGASLTSNIMSLLLGRRLRKDENNLKLSVDYSDVAFIYMGPSDPTSIMPPIRKVLEFFKIAGYDKVQQIVQGFQTFIEEEIDLHKTAFKDVEDFINTYLKKISDLTETNKENHIFSERMLKGNLSILFLGASDTIFSSLGWLFRLMSKHKDIQERVHKELMDVLGNDGRARYEERHRIPYTFAVLMEGQRFASNVPLSTTRKASQDIHINGYVIPKGSEITSNLWGLHHDPNYWDEPEKFKPERFLIKGGTELIKNPPSYAPFSIGRRNCPGETIAWIEILLYFSEVIKKFEISTPPAVEPEFNIINGLVSRLTPQPLCFKERKN